LLINKTQNKKYILVTEHSKTVGLAQGGQPAALKENYAAQSWIESRRFSDILGVFLQFLSQNGLMQLTHPFGWTTSGLVRHFLAKEVMGP
jgi:hypothetical protein